MKLAQGDMTSWSAYLSSAVYAYNTSEQSSTKHTPFELMFGRAAKLPYDFGISDTLSDDNENNDDADDSEVLDYLRRKRAEDITDAKKNIDDAQRRQKIQYDKKHAKTTSFEPGDEVLVKDILRKRRAGGKLDFRFKGPYVVQKDMGKKVFLLRRGAEERRVKSYNMKLYVRRDNDVSWWSHPKTHLSG